VNDQRDGAYEAGTRKEGGAIVSTEALPIVQPLPPSEQTTRPIGAYAAQAFRIDEFSESMRVEDEDGLEHEVIGALQMRHPKDDHWVICGFIRWPAGTRREDVFAALRGTPDSKADTQRMDWIEETLRSPEGDFGIDLFGASDGTGAIIRVRSAILGIEGATVREAIDSGMRRGAANALGGQQ
jgi:hypothetical protein